jgi:tetratricopeptide (TPR) repeat protein
MRLFLSHDMVLPLSLAFIAFLTFANAIYHPFVHDDIAFIVQNPQIGHLDHLAGIFFQTMNSAGHEGLNIFYRPVLEIFYRLEYRCFGFNAAGFHLVNIAVHILNGLLLFVLLCRLKFSRPMACAVSLLFLIHPVQTEAVDSVVGISNLLSAFFLLSTLICYVEERHALACVMLVLSFFTKEGVVVAPVLFILLDWYQDKKGRAGLWLFFLLLAIGFLGLRSAVTHAHVLETIFQPAGMPHLRFLSIPRTMLMYMRLVVMPYDLHYYRNTDLFGPNAYGFIVLGLLFAALGAAVRSWQAERRGIILGGLWFMICLLPVLNILPIFNEGSLMLTPEHFLYLPMIGLMIVLAVIFTRLVPSRLQLGLALAIFAVLGLATMHQNLFWRGPVALFERTVAFEPSFGRGHLLLAEAYFLNRQEDPAIAEYARALSIMKRYERAVRNDMARHGIESFMKMIYMETAECLQNKGRLDQAVLNYKEALKLDPRDVQALNLLAVCYWRMGEKAEAQQILRAALELDPSYMPVRENLKQLTSD